MKKNAVFKPSSYIKITEDEADECRVEKLIKILVENAECNRRNDERKAASVF